MDKSLQVVRMFHASFSKPLNSLSLKSFFCAVFSLFGRLVIEL